MFNIPSEEIGRVTSDLTMYSIPFSMVTTFFVSYMFEIWGRKLTIVVSYLLSAIVYFILPHSAPNYTLLLVMRCLIAITMSAPISHPLIADYVKRSSRGKAIALAGVGIVLGEVFSMGILFNLTKSMSYYDAFAIASGLIFAFTIFFMFSLKEPDLEVIRDNQSSKHQLLFNIQPPMSDRKRSLSVDHPTVNRLELNPHQNQSATFKEKSFLTKVKELTFIVYQEMVLNPVLFMCIVGGTITKLISVLFSTYLILWIQTFVTGTNGSARILGSKEQGKTIYSNIMVIATLISAFVLPVVGKVCDSYTPKITIPFAFVFRAVTTIFFAYVENPQSYGSLAICISMIIATIVENISVDTIFNKNLPKETRGVLNGVYSMAGQLGILMYSKYGGILFDDFGPKYPFYLIGLLDLLFALGVLICIPFGLFNYYESKETYHKLKMEGNSQYGSQSVMNGKARPFFIHAEDRSNEANFGEFTHKSRMSRFSEKVPQDEGESYFFGKRYSNH